MIKDETTKFDMGKDSKDSVEDIILRVYKSLNEKNYNALDQMVGYIISGDPTYITSHNNARQLMKQIDRSDILEVLLKDFIKKHE